MLKEPVASLENDLYGEPLSGAYAVADHYHKHFGESAAVVICIIFFYLDVLLYARYTTDAERERTEQELRKIYKESNLKFSSDAEYLFFAGYLSAISYWLFGEDSDLSSKQRVLRAVQLDPTNLVYKWAHHTMIDNRSHHRLAREINQDREIILWIKSFGAAGNYVLESIDEEQD